jgi:PAS domain S-box-containing protein
MEDSIRILIVDGDPGRLSANSRILKSAKYEVFKARTGTEALETAKAERPDMVLMDVVLPDMNGMEVCKRIRSDGDPGGLQVILTSSLKKRTGRRAEELESGADGYILRPISERAFLARIASAARIITVERKVRESEERYRLLLQNANDAVYVHVVSPEGIGKILEVNDRACQMLGYSREEFLAMDIPAIDVPEQAQRVPAIIRQLFETGQAVFETEHKAKDNHRIPVEVSTRRFQIRNVPTALSIVRDITDRKRTEEALKKSEEKFRKAFDIGPDSVNINRLEDGMYISINQGFTRITGYTEADIIGKTSIEYNIWANMEDRQRLVAGLRKEGEVMNLDAAFRMKGGDIRYGLMSASMIDLDGVPHILNITRDITERRRAEEALKESEKKYRLVIDNAEEAILIAQDGMLKYVNPMTMSILGYSEEELLAKPFIGIIHPEDREKLMTAHIRRMQSEDPQPVRQFRVVCKDGSVKWADSNTVVISWEGKPATLNFLTDVTERKQAEEALDKSFAKLRDALGATVQAIAVTVETRDPYTAGHQRRVADLARSIATEIGLTADQSDGIHMAGIIHDLGKISVPAEILSKPTRLTEIEFSLIKIHAQSGYDILKDIEFPWPIARMVLEHHERMNGSGYPNGLKGDQSLFESRIMSVADVVEAMASHRPYRPALGLGAALEEITKSKGLLYDPDVVDACLRLFNEKGYKIQN